MKASSDIDTLSRCIILFIIDASDSMQGVKIGTVNSAIEEIVPELKDISESNLDVALYIGALKVSNSTLWLHHGLIRAEDFEWHDIHAGGDRNFGTALLELGKKLQYGGFFEDGIDYFKPIIFLLTDGILSDNYTVGLNLLKGSSIFQNAIKVGVAIGEAADRKFLSEFVEDEDHIITVHTPESLIKWIRFDDLE